MNSILIYKKSDFNRVLQAPILLTGDTSLHTMEMQENMWGIALSLSASKIITKNEIQFFLDELIKKKQEQAKNLPATFYMWHDEQTTQLRFNILSGNLSRLPFGCLVNRVETFACIVNSFGLRPSSKN